MLIMICIITVSIYSQLSKLTAQVDIVIVQSDNTLSLSTLSFPHNRGKDVRKQISSM